MLTADKLQSLLMLDRINKRWGLFKKLRRSSEGVHAPHNKATETNRTRIMPVPDKIYLPLRQHIGAPTKAVVKKGDKVQVGTMVAETGGFVSSPIFSGVSGTVKDIVEMQFIFGKEKCIVIESDKEQTMSDDIAPPKVNDYDSFVKAIANSGLVGLGGAGFPTAVKLSPKNLTAIDTLIINAAECEPYITADNREMLECPDHVMAGIVLVKRFLGIKNIIIGIERNKPEAVDLLFSLAAGDKSITVVPLETRYPQGAEKVLIETTTGREVPIGGLPSDVGVIVLNVATVAFISKYIENGIPLISKRITVDGDAITSPQNVEVIIGTPIKDIVDYCGGFSQTVGKLLMGGPMMGITVPNTDLPIQKQTNAILALSEKLSKPPVSKACIRCGRCLTGCPMGLSPVEISDSYEIEDVKDLADLNVASCIECGCCSFTCPAKRPLTPIMKLAKVMLRGRS